MGQSVSSCKGFYCKNININILTKISFALGMEESSDEKWLALSSSAMLDISENIDKNEQILIPHIEKMPTFWANEKSFKRKPEISADSDALLSIYGEFDSHSYITAAEVQDFIDDFLELDGIFQSEILRDQQSYKCVYRYYFAAVRRMKHLLHSSSPQVETVSTLRRIETFFEISKLFQNIANIFFCSIDYCIICCI